MDERDTVPPKIRKLSVIVPVFNERNTVVEVVRRMRAVELPDGIEREIIVVDDGSSDGTRDVLRQLGDSTVRVVVHARRNRGKGAAVRTGLALATGDYVLIQDADLEYDPDDWPRLIAPVMRGRARVVYGSRFTGERRNMLFLHWVGNRLLSLVTNVLYNTTLSDMETCYKLVDRKLLVDLGLRSRPLRHRTGDHGQDPEAPDPHLRGADLLHGSRVRRRQEDHVARRLRGVVDAREVPLWRLTTDQRPRWAAVVVNFEAGPLLVECVGSLLADTSAGPMELVVVDNASKDDSIATLLAAHPGVRVVARARQRGLRPGRESRDRGNEGADRRGAQPRHRRASRAPPARSSRGSNANRASRRAGPACAISTAPTTRRPAAMPSIPVAIGHGLLGLWWPTNPFTARYRQLDADPALPAPRRLGVGRRDLAAPPRARRRRRLGRAVLHVSRRHRPVLAACAARAGRSRTNRAASSSTCRARARRGARTACCSSTIDRPGDSPRTRLTGARAVLLPFAAMYFAVRAVMAMAEHAWRSSRSRRRPTNLRQVRAPGKP